MQHLIEDDTDIPCCMACAVPLKDGDKVYNELDGGIIHADCCGPERENYYGENEQPLADGEPIPEPRIWTPDTPALTDQ